MANVCTIGGANVNVAPIVMSELPFKCDMYVHSEQWFVSFMVAI